MNSTEAMNQLLWNTRLFIKDIVGECTADATKYHMRLEVSQQCVKVLIYNQDSGQIVGQAYDIKRFLELCQTKKIEFQLNQDVRRLILESDKKVERTVNWI